MTQKKISSSTASTNGKLMLFANIQKALNSGLADQEKDILVRHFGLEKDENLSQENKVLTLDKIGKSYGLTRERIRQIEKRAVDKIKKTDLYHKSILPIADMVVKVLEKYHGVLLENDLLVEVLQKEDTPENRRSLIFVLTKMFDDRIIDIKPTGNFLKSWRLKSLQIKYLEEITKGIINLFKDKDRVLKIDAVWDNFRETDIYKKNRQNLSQDAILSYMRVSKYLDRTVFGEWGLVSWGMVNLKRVSNKVYVVLQETNKPLHFRELTALINDRGLDNKRVHAPTVHNELIADSRFMLLGRGVYALTEWGYLSGTTAEVIEKILSESGGPVHKEELIKEVLKHKAIKKQTVLSVLMNNDRFQKHDKDHYVIKKNK
ncbi:MAG: sigma factor-like helix-turn-helix DNA-binding protein [Patescibacteria group bacterium]|jgi:hypothetical protein|nr:sigma factor-like helix-turn-helix DNA-binding protein [Patescibacteria group bacterium]